MIASRPSVLMRDGDELIPKERYTSADFLRLEWDRMWTRVWLLAGREADVARPGDYLTYSIGPESILVTRDGQGRLGAFYNVCMHRGARLRQARMGHGERLVCGYHGWDWGLDGALRRPSDVESFPAGIPERCRRLRSVRCDEWGGFVWICLDPNAPSLLDYLGPVTRILDPFSLSEHTLLRDLTVEWECNWKSAMDNGNETYHVQGIHPQLLELIDDYEVGPELFERHSRFCVRFGSPSFRLEDRSKLREGLAGILRKAGIEPAQFSTNALAVRDALRKHVRERLAAEGRTYPKLQDDQMIDNEHVYIFPNLMFNILVPGFWTFQARPHPTDPGRMFFDFQEYERLPRGAKAPARPEHRRYRYGEVSLDAVLDQDAAVMPIVQQGMGSSAFEGLLLGTQESRLRHMHDTLTRYIERD